MTKFELAVQDTDGVGVAWRVKADRIELCTALSLGGLTPSAGLIAYAVDGPSSTEESLTKVPVNVLIRPRLGGFEFSPDELEVMMDDVSMALSLGVSGVVIGSLKEGNVDRDFVTHVRSLAQGADVTFHRAFDVVDDQHKALETLIDCGVDRILTSGGASKAIDALPRLEHLVEWADGRIQIMAGSGVSVDNARMIMATGVDAIHASAKHRVADCADIGLDSLDKTGVDVRESTDPAKAHMLRDIANEGVTSP